jgi:hypothetical protein
MSVDGGAEMRMLTREFITPEGQNRNALAQSVAVDLSLVQSCGQDGAKLAELRSRGVASRLEAIVRRNTTFPTEKPWGEEEHVSKVVEEVVALKQQIAEDTEEIARINWDNLADNYGQEKYVDRNNVKAIVARELVLEDTITNLIQQSLAGTIDLVTFMPRNRLEITALQIATDIKEKAQLSKA